MTYRWRIALVLVVALAGVTGCADWRGVNTLSLPGTEGGGPGSFVVRAQMPDVNNLEPNARVRVDDVTVGAVTRIERQGWHALVTMRLDGSVRLPANATAKLGQTSILGSQHIELAPPEHTAPEGVLRDGSVIALENAGMYPTTEQTLASLSAVLNGGAIGQIYDITEALSLAFAGREDDLRNLVDQLDLFATQLNDQSGDIIAAAESLNDLIGRFAAQEPVLDRALTTIPDALAVLTEQRDSLVDSVDRLGRLGTLVTETVTETRHDLVRILEHSGPVLARLADAGPAMTRGLSGIVTYPFPFETIELWQRGDYANLTAVFDLTLSRLDAGFFTGTRWECHLTWLEMQWGRTIGQFPSPCTAGGPGTPGNPLTIPYRWDQGP